MGDEQDGKRLEDLAARLRCEDGDDPDLAAFREAAARHMPAEADRLYELTPEQKLAEARRERVAAAE